MPPVRSQLSSQLYSLYARETRSIRSFDYFSMVKVTPSRFHHRSADVQEFSMGEYYTADDMKWKCSRREFCTHTEKERKRRLCVLMGWLAPCFWAELKWWRASWLSIQESSSENSGQGCPLLVWQEGAAAEWTRLHAAATGKMER